MPGIHAGSSRTVILTWRVFGSILAERQCRQ
jgi:hypothetical protein